MYNKVFANHYMYIRMSIRMCKYMCTLHVICTYVYMYVYIIFTVWLVLMFLLLGVCALSRWTALCVNLCNVYVGRVYIFV